MIDIIFIYLFIGIFAAVYSFIWSYPDSKAPIRAYVLIIIIWPYQLYLQWKYEND